MREDSPASGPDGGVGSHAFAPAVAIGYAQIDWSGTLERYMTSLAQMPYPIGITGGDRVVRSAKGSVRADPEVGAAYEHQRSILQRMKAEKDQLASALVVAGIFGAIVKSSPAQGCTKDRWATGALSIAGLGRNPERCTFLDGCGAPVSEHLRYLAGKRKVSGVGPSEIEARTLQ